MGRSRTEVLQLVVDCMILLASLFLSYYVRVSIDIGIPGVPETFVVPTPLYGIILLVWMTIFVQNDVYVHRFGTKFRFRLLNMIRSHVIACFLYFGVLYLAYRDFSRFQSFYFVSFALIGMTASRILIRLVTIFFFEREERLLRVLIVGTGANAAQLRDKIRSNPRHNLNLVGFIRLPFDDETAPGLDSEIVGDLRDLPKIVEEKRIGEVVIVPRWYSSDVSEEISRLMFDLQRFPVNIRLAPDFSQVSFFHTVTENFGGLPLIGVRTPIFSPRQRLLKRALDLVVAVPVVIVLSPVLALVAVAIRRDSEGPAILRQERVGINGNRFVMFKFRSMYVNHKELEFDETQVNVMKRPYDPRITRVGRILRRTSLDELPQLFNVIRGDMSLVGPRPELPALVAAYEWWQYKRFEVPQGMTGWWQINGRANRPMHLHTEDDLYYIQNYSLWLDLQILFRTIKIVFTGSGAF
ncbi:MAG: sugar transferase [Anaerolineae bacterium]|nr:sugar transferase [Anaerolineae bacterium]